jgi:hypothetical protein
VVENAESWQVQTSWLAVTSVTSQPACVQTAEKALKTPALGWTIIKAPTLELTLTPEPTGTLLLAIKAELLAEGEGVVAADATVASKKPLESRSFTTSKRWLPEAALPVSKLKVRLSLEQVTRVPRTLEDVKAVESLGQTARYARYLLVLCR